MEFLALIWRVSVPSLLDILIKVINFQKENECDKIMIKLTNFSETYFKNDDDENSRI